MTFSTCMRGVTASGLGRCLRPEGPRPYNQQMPRIWKMPRWASERSSCRISKRCCAPRTVILKVPCRGTERQATH